jgi:hypothetical protein
VRFLCLVLFVASAAQAKGRLLQAAKESGDSEELVRDFGAKIGFGVVARVSRALMHGALMRLETAAATLTSKS